MDKRREKINFFLIRLTFFIIIIISIFFFFLAQANKTIGTFKGSELTKD